MPIWLIKVGLWLKNRWYIPFLLLGAVIIYVLLRPKESPVTKVIQRIDKAKAEEKETIEKIEKKREEKAEAIRKQKEEADKEVDEVTIKFMEDLKNKLKKESEGRKDDPEGTNDELNKILDD